ncbi:Inositol polyphosphate 5-phosphatase [Entamoeba marina]
MSVSGILKDNKTTSKATDLSTTVASALKNINTTSYQPLTVLQLGGVVLVGFLSNRLAEHLTHTGHGCEAVGAMGMANKGGVAFSFTLYSTTFCIVGSHLAAHQNEVAKRNHNFADIYNNATIHRDNPADGDDINISSHDVVFWLGDLNYRVDTEDAMGNPKELLRTDQLKCQQETNALLNKFVEPAITFQPTYKFVVGTDTYDEKRRPAYCDRILVCDEQGLKISCMLYESIKDIKLSDHKPVRACFSVQAREVVPETFAAVEKQLIDKENKLLRLVRPEIQVDTQEFDIDVKLYEETTACVVVRNSGKAKTSIIIKDHHLGKYGGFPQWLEVTPSVLDIPRTDTGPHTVKFKFCFRPSGNRLAAFDNGDEMNYNLILEVQGGTNLFLVFKLRLNKTSFGNDLDVLNHLPNGILVRQPIAFCPLVVPKEIWRLCDRLLPHLSDPNILSTKPSLDVSHDYKSILAALDNHTSFPSLPHSRFMEFLLVFLIGLREPIIPTSLYTQLATTYERTDSDIDKFFIKNSSTIPTANYNLLPADGEQRHCDSKAIAQFLTKYLKK